MYAPLASMLAELHIPQATINILAAKGVKDTNALRLCGWPVPFNDMPSWSRVLVPFPSYLHGLTRCSIRICRIHRSPSSSAFHVLLCRPSHRPHRLTPPFSSPIVPNHNNHSHLTDSLDELKAVGVKGRHAKKLLERCSLSGVTMLPLHWASHMLPIP